MQKDTKSQIAFTMRMDEKLYLKLKKQAEKDRRSIAKELEFLTYEALINKED